MISLSVGYWMIIQAHVTEITLNFNQLAVDRICITVELFFLENGYVSGLCSRTQPCFYKILNKQADKIGSTQTT